MFEYNLAAVAGFIESRLPEFLEFSRSSSRFRDNKSRFGQKRAELDRRVRERVLRKLTESREADDIHPYLLDNNVRCHDLNIDRNGNLLAVGVDLKASFTGTGYKPQAQTMLSITPSGKFRQEKWAATSGAAIMIGHRQFREIAREPFGAHEIYVAEDYASGAFLHEGIGGPVAVTLRLSNLKSVVQILKDKFPRAHIVVCLNNPEEWDERRKKTVSELQKYDVITICPEFSKREREHALVSFNDRAMMTQAGTTVSAVKGLIQSRINQRLERIRRDHLEMMAALNGAEGESSLAAA